MSKIIESIKTFEDALKATVRPDVPEFLELPEDIREYFKAQYKILVITEALNEGWKADMMDTNQKRWFPVFRTDPSSPSGLVFGSSFCHYSGASASVASRLCFKSVELATYAGEQFLELYKNFIM